MPNQRVRFQREYEAPPRQVFALFADHERFGKLLGAPCKRIKNAPDGDDPNGVGSVRRVANGPAAFEETVLVCEPPKLIEYTVTRGGPIKNHRGRIEFNTTANNGTRVTYTIEFDPRVPLTATAINLMLNKVIGRAMNRVPRHV